MHTSSAYMVGVWMGALIVGGVCGLVPLIAGIQRGRMGLALAGLVSCIVGGLILGLVLAVPIAAVFTLIIVTQKRPGA